MGRKNVWYRRCFWILRVSRARRARELADDSGNVDLTGVFQWIGKTQLQILSFMTSFLLILAHTSTSWAVTERVLLHDK